MLYQVVASDAPPQGQEATRSPVSTEGRLPAHSKFQTLIWLTSDLHSLGVSGTV